MRVVEKALYPPLELILRLPIHLAVREVRHEERDLELVPVVDVRNEVVGKLLALHELVEREQAGVRYPNQKPCCIREKYLLLRCRVNIGEEVVHEVADVRLFVLREPLRPEDFEYVECKWPRSPQGRRDVREPLRRKVEHRELWKKKPLRRHAEDAYAVLNMPVREALREHGLAVATCGNDVAVLEEKVERYVDVDVVVQDEVVHRPAEVVVDEVAVVSVRELLNLPCGKARQVATMNEAIHLGVGEAHEVAHLDAKTSRLSVFGKPREDRVEGRYVANSLVALVPVDIDSERDDSARFAFESEVDEANKVVGNPHTLGEPRDDLMGDVHDCASVSRRFGRQSRAGRVSRALQARQVPQSLPG